MRSRSYLPPRKKDWKPGAHQVGVFVRTDTGSVIEVVLDSTTKELAQAVLAAVRMGEVLGVKAVKDA